MKLSGISPNWKEYKEQFRISKHDARRDQADNIKKPIIHIKSVFVVQESSTYTVIAPVYMLYAIRVSRRVDVLY